MHSREGHDCGDGDDGVVSVMVSVMVPAHACA